VTVIAGVAEKGLVVMGADSGSVLGEDEMTVVKSHKVWRRQGWLMGFSGSWRVGNVLQRYLKPEPAPDTDKAIEVAVGGLAEQMQDIFRTHKVKHTDEHWDALFGTHGNLYYIGVDLSWQQIAQDKSKRRESHYAIGSGGREARAALSALAGMGVAPRKRITRALNVAAECNAYVRGPFKILTLSQ